MMASGTIFDIKEFTVHDGPGIRATVFLKGCPLRCLWCHNPEGLSAQPQLMITEAGCVHCGRCKVPCAHAECAGLGRCTCACPAGLVKVSGERMDAADVAARMHRIAPMLKGGGVTLSGGEPLMQPEFALELLSRLRPLHTIVQTSGYAAPEVFRAVASAADAIYLDIKHADSNTHKALTGAPNDPILENLGWIKASGRSFLVRVPLIPGLNDDSANLEATAALLEGAKNLTHVELLTYNPFAGAKYQPLGMDFALDGLEAGNHEADIGAAFDARGIAWRKL